MLKLNIILIQWEEYLLRTEKRDCSCKQTQLAKTGKKLQTQEYK